MPFDNEIFPQLLSAVDPLIVYLAGGTGTLGTLFGVILAGRRWGKRYTARKLDAQRGEAEAIAEAWIRDNLSTVVDAFADANNQVAKKSLSKQQVAARKRRRAARASRKANR